jgi:hypothetical protein
MVVKIKMESDPIEEAEPEAIIPMEVVSSGGQSAIEDPEAIIPIEILSSGGQSATTATYISMQAPPITPAEDDQASIPPEHVRSSPNLNRAVTLRRTAAKRTLPWDLRANELELVSSPPQADETQATKRPKLEESFPASTVEAAGELSPHDTAVALPPDAADHHHADSDLLTSGEASKVAESTSEEAFLPQEQPTSVDASSQNSEDPPGQQLQPGQHPQYPMQPHPPQQMHMPYSMPAQGDYYGGQMPMHPWQQRVPTGPHPGYHSGQYMPPQQMLGPGMYQRQMYPGMSNMAPNTILGPSGMPYYPGQGGQMPYRAAATMLVVDQGLNPSIALASGRKGKWSAVEDSKLKDAVQKHGVKDWAAITALVPGRTQRQCHNRWDTLDVNIALNARRMGKWVEDEDKKLKDAVQARGGKTWGTIAALVPGRTQRQCRNRWQIVLDPSIDRTPSERTGKWAENEDIKLKDAVQMHGGKNWDAIAALVPGRTEVQCSNRWYTTLDPAWTRHRQVRVNG